MYLWVGGGGWEVRLLVFTMTKVFAVMFEMIHIVLFFMGSFLVCYSLYSNGNYCTCNHLSQTEHDSL